MTIAKMKSKLCPNHIGDGSYRGCVVCRALKKKIEAKELPVNIQMAVRDIVWMARRYAEGRLTGAPSLFNSAYNELRMYIDFEEEKDPDNRIDENRPVKNFPLATGGKLP